MGEVFTIIPQNAEFRQIIIVSLIYIQVIFNFNDN